MKNSSRLKFIGLGECLWDLLPGGKQPGGAPANFAWHVNQLGGEGIVVTAVGDDALGRELVGVLREHDLSPDHVQVRSDLLTGTVSVEVDSSGQPRYVIHEHVAWDAIEWSDALAALAAEADCVCVGSLAQRSEISRQTIGRFLDNTLANCLRIFDINLRQHYYNASVIEENLRRCDVLKLNDDEWPIIAELFACDALLPHGPQQFMRRFDLRVIALTRGRQGSLIIERDNVIETPGRDVKVADTIGAGDSFTATLAVGLLQGRPLREIAEHATAVAAYVCTQHGATPKLPGKLANWSE